MTNRLKTNVCIFIVAELGPLVAEMATPSPTAPLREFCPLYYLLNAIPAKVQKGFRSVLVYLTALDSNSDYIAVGTSISVLYLYGRRVSQMNKYSLEVRILQRSPEKLYVALVESKETDILFSVRDGLSRFRKQRPALYNIF